MRLSLIRRCAAAVAATVSLAAAGAGPVALAERVAAAAAPTGAAIVTANEILNRWEPLAAAAGAHPPAWREQFYTQLVSLPAQWLRMFDALTPNPAADARTEYGRFTQMFVNATANIASARHASESKLASATSDLVFVPIVPCRIVDTRNAGTPVPAGTLAKFVFYADTGTFSFATQGGVAGAAVSACPATVLASGGGTLGTVPPAAAAATITVVNATAAGNYVVWGGSAPIPTISVLNWTGPGQTLANTSIIPAGGRTGGNLDFAVFYNGPSGQADVVVDVVGYYVENAATPLQCTTQVASGGGSVATGTALTVAYPACLAGYARTGSGCAVASPVGANVYLQGDATGGAGCVYFNNSGSSIPGITFQAQAVCCRLPGQ